MIKRVLLLLMILFMVLCLGCWEQVEMDKRAYILTLLIDEYDEKKTDISMIRDENIPKYNFVFEIVTLKGGGGADSANRQGDESFFVTVGTHSIVQAMDVLETTVENPAIMTHLQAVIIDENVAKEGIIHISDYLLRSPEVRRITYVFISKGPISDILKFKPDISGTVGEFLSELTLNSEESSLLLTHDNLEVVSYSLANGMDFLLPKLNIKSGRLICKGAAVMDKKGKFIAWVDNEDVFEGARFIRGLYSRGDIMVSCPITNNNVIIRIRKARTKIKTYPDMSVLVDISVIANISSNMGGKVAMDEEYILNAYKGIETEIKNKVKEAINFFQKELKTDVFFSVKNSGIISIINGRNLKTIGLRFFRILI